MAAAWCLEVRGIPGTEEEDTTELVCQVSNLVGVGITESDVSTSHRIQPKTNTSKFPPSIIAKYVLTPEMKCIMPGASGVTT